MALTNLQDHAQNLLNAYDPSMSQLWVTPNSSSNSNALIMTSSGLVTAATGMLQVTPAINIGQPLEIPKLQFTDNPILKKMKQEAMEAFNRLYVNEENCACDSCLLIRVAQAYASKKILLLV